MSTAAALAAAMVLDALLGEPRWLWSRLPHPAVVMGRAVAYLDTSLNTAPAQRLKGVFALLLLTGGAAVLGAGLSLGGPLVEIGVAAVLLAQKSLVQHVRAVADGLRLSTGDGRLAVAMIVSRDTRDMHDAQIARAAIESASENLSDGIIAPAFWFLLGGLPGMLAYKAVNTADSMIGYLTPRHAAFGWAAARLDDLLNLLPARLTALLILAVASPRGTWRAIAADARHHRSPNAGWPEAAMARALNVALAGPRSYQRRMQPLAWVNREGQRDIGPDEIDAAIAILWRVWAFCLATLCAAILLMTAAG